MCIIKKPIVLIPGFFPGIHCRKTIFGTLFTLPIQHSTKTHPYCMLQMKTIENIIENLKILFNQIPEDPAIYYNIACIYEKMNKVEDAAIWHELAIKKGFKLSNLQ
jgi:hypothetical protein